MSVSAIPGRARPGSMRLGVVGVEQITQTLGFRFVVGPEIRTTIQQEQRLGFRFVVGPIFREDYTGPGSGLVVTGERPLPLLLNEGDTFQLDRPYGGLMGQSGLARVLSLALDDDLNGDWRIQYIPHTDTAFAELLDELGRPRYTVEISGNIVRQLRELQRGR